MRLALSTDAAPDLPLEDLLDGCRRRGLSGLELVVRDPAIPRSSEITRALAAAADEGIELSVLYSIPFVPETAATLRFWASTGLPLVVAADEREPGELIQIADVVVEVGGRLLMLHPSDATIARRLREAVEEMPPPVAGLAWQVDPTSDRAEAIENVLESTGAALRYVRLRGGGPESAAQTGMGIGPLMARLTLSRFDGLLVMTPSTDRYRTAWRAWLERGRGWGCGSKQSDPSLVPLMGRLAPG